MTKKSLRRILQSMLCSASAAMVSWPVSTVAPATAATLQKPLIPVTRDFTLPNGLRVLLSEDHSVPVAALAIVYDVGARDERKGRSGFAHFFEHMMFQGSENVAKMDHFKYVEGAGGTLNASTHPDFTNYFEKVPSNQIELALWLEADRMRSLKVTPENFKNQLETVKEEKRQSIDNQPYMPAAIKLEELLFDNWSNQHPVIGSFEDLDAAKVDDIRAFFKIYYAPNNAVMAIVGDFDAATMQKLVEKYFATIPKVEAPPKPSVAEGPQKTPKKTTVVDSHAKLPAFWLGWKAPPRRDPDGPALVMLEKVLASGESSRLYQRMIKGDQVAINADAGYDSRRGPGAFEAFVVYKAENKIDKVQDIVWSEIEKLQKEPVTTEELEKARNQYLRKYFSSSGYSSLQRSLGRAEMLAENTLFYGDPKTIDEDLEAVMKVTTADIQRVAKKYLTRDGITIVDIETVAEGKEKDKEKKDKS